MRTFLAAKRRSRGSHPVAFVVISIYFTAQHLRDSLGQHRRYHYAKEVDVEEPPRRFETSLANGGAERGAEQVRLRIEVRIEHRECAQGRGAGLELRQILGGERALAWYAPRSLLA